MLQNPFAVRPSYTTLNALQLVHNPIPTLHGPSTVSLQRRTTLLQRSTTRSRSLLQFHLQRHTTLPQRSTTRSQSHHNALRPYCSFVTNANTTLLQRVRHPITMPYNPSTTFYNPSSNVIQPSYNALRPFYSFVTTPCNALQPSYSFRYDVIQPF